MNLLVTLTYPHQIKISPAKKAGEDFKSLEVLKIMTSMSYRPGFAIFL